MALAVSNFERMALRNKLALVFNIAFDSSYPTGGESLTAADLGMSRIHYVNVAPNSGYLFEYDYDNSKLKALTPVSAQAAHTHANTLTQTTEDNLLSHSGADIAGSANTDSSDTDQAAAPTNGNSVAAQAAVAASAWSVGAITNPGTGRNICVTIENDSGGPLDLYEGDMTFSITGTWRGAAQTEDIVITSTSGNKAVADTKFRYKYGDKPFDTVTGITLDNVPADGLKIGAGIGSKIGLPTDLATPAEADVTNIVKNGADLSPSGIVDTTNMTVNLGTLSDNDDFTIVYESASLLASSSITNVAGGAITAAAADEVANTTDLSGLTSVRAFAVGF